MSQPRFQWIFLSLAVVIPLELAALVGYHLIFPIEVALFLLLFFTLGLKMAWEGIKSLFRAQFSNIRLLMTLAIAGALYLQHLPEAMIILVLYQLGEELENYGVTRSQKSLRQLVQEVPKTAEVKGKEEEIPVEDIELGETLVIRPGSTIPLDGVVAQGTSWVDESTITGETQQASKSPGDKVYAGTTNTRGYLEVEVTHLSQDTTLAKIIDLTYRAQELKSPSQRTIENFAAYYTPAVIVLAVLLVVIPVWWGGGSLELWLNQGISLLLIACPCALVLSTPVAVYSAIGHASKKGVVIKGGKYLEELGRLKVMAFDKTRTLTTGQMEVTQVVNYKGFSSKELLGCAAGMEEKSEHPIGQSIITKARQEEVNFHHFSQFEAAPGKGLKGSCVDCQVSHHCLGTLTFVQEEHFVEDAIQREIKNYESQGKTTLVMSNDREVKGLFVLSDEIRPESRQTLENLKKQGLKLALLSGDNHQVVQAVAKKLDIDRAKGNLLPEDKVQEIENLEREFTHVAMVGDGINDAPSLAQASVGIVLGAVGSDVAVENANIALMGDRLALLPYLIDLARKTLKKIRLNIFLAVFVKVIFLLLALAGQSHIALAIFADVGITLIVVVNSLALFGFQSDFTAQ